jgi:GDP-L-fucose synthase
MKVLVTGGAGFLGKYVIKELADKSYNDIVVVRSKDYDLRSCQDTYRMFADHGPDAVIHLAAVVGGIGANKENPGRFFYDNMMMGLNIIEGSRLYNVKKFVQVGTVCSYPKYCTVPFQEKDMWSGYPE